MIASAWGWDTLTNLPRTNGLAGFIASVLAQDLDDSVRHDENTGCIYDFLWDKQGIDARLRSGVVCRECYARLRQLAEIPGRRLDNFDCSIAEGVEDLTILLDEIALASKREVDVLVRWQTKAGVSQEFDVFLCHNSDDKPSVRLLYEGLRDRGVTPWLDEEHLRPGQPWQRELEATIPRIKTAAVVVGPHGRGPWQDVELDAFIREFANRACPVIPVLLGDAGAAPPLPIFLRAFTWVDFRRDRPDPWRQLLWGITGTRPV
jgi:TIR domain